MRSGRCAASFLAVAILGCGTRRDPDEGPRRDWIFAETAKHNVYLRQFLNGTPDIEFFDGWYAVENDPKTGGAWRWMGKRSITRLRTKLGGASEPSDMTATVYGWTAQEHMGFRTAHMEFAVNGHVLDAFDPPEKDPFQRAIFVPRWLLEHAAYVDFAITIANTATPRGDWREIGFATTGIVWKPAEKP